MRTISSFATAISFRSGLLVPDGTGRRGPWFLPASGVRHRGPGFGGRERSEEHTSELQSLMRISYAVFCLKKKTQIVNSDRHAKDAHEIATYNTASIQ